MGKSLLKNKNEGIYRVTQNISRWPWQLEPERKRGRVRGRFTNMPNKQNINGK